MTNHTRHSFDSKCYDLAAAFLEELVGATEDDIRALAQELQAECEAACQEVEARVAMRERDKEERRHGM